jgi:PAP_fibrillin
MMGKAALKTAIAGKNRGLLASEPDKQAILALIATLEEQNPTPRPVEAADLLNGDWRLLYTTSKGLLNIGRIPFLKLGQIYQCIRVNSNSIYNIAEIYGLPFFEGIVSVAATFEPVDTRRVQVKFERSIITLQRLIDYNSPEKFIEKIEAGKKFTGFDFPITNSERQGWLDITYLDSDFRIGRGNEGSVFVLTKT